MNTVLRDYVLQYWANGETRYWEFQAANPREAKQVAVNHMVRTPEAEQAYARGEWSIDLME